MSIKLKMINSLLCMCYAKYSFCCNYIRIIEYVKNQFKRNIYSIDFQRLINTLIIIATLKIKFILLIYHIVNASY